MSTGIAGWAVFFFLLLTIIQSWEYPSSGIIWGRSSCRVDRVKARNWPVSCNGC